MDRRRQQNLLVQVGKDGKLNQVDEILMRIQKTKGIVGVIVVNDEGIPVRTNMDNATTVQYASQIQQLITQSRSVVRDLDPTNDLSFLRIRSKKHEIMVSPENDHLVIVVQETNPDAPKK